MILLLAIRHQEYLQFVGAFTTKQVFMPVEAGIHSHTLARLSSGGHHRLLGTKARQDGLPGEKERETGLEPATACLGSRNSTTELLPLAMFQLSVMLTGVIIADEETKVKCFVL